MEWLTLVTAICLQIAPSAKVKMETCETHYKSCVEQLASQPGAKEKGLTEDKIASALYEIPSSRITLCK